MCENEEVSGKVVKHRRSFNGKIVAQFDAKIKRLEERISKLQAELEDVKKLRESVAA